MIRKKLFSVLLCCLLVLSICPVTNAAGTVTGAEAVAAAQTLVGKYPYVSGGKSPSNGGFDCTGLVYYVYHDLLGCDVTWNQIWSRSVPGTKISEKSNLLPGDIVFGLNSSGGWHTGLYYGNNTMIHAGLSSGVSKTSINGAWFTFKFATRPSFTKTTSSSAPGVVGKTSKPSVSVNGQTVAVSWSYSGSASKFDVYLVQDPWRWADIKYQTTVTGNSCAFNNVSPGEYRAFVIARPNTDFVQSEWSDNISVGNTNNNESKPTVVSRESGNWNIKLSGDTPIYEDVFATNRTGTYAHHTISCTEKAILSDGTTRYCAQLQFPDGVYPRWITFTSGMTVENQQASAPKSYTVTFDPNGGVIGQAFVYKDSETITVTEWGTYGTLPPCRADNRAIGDAHLYWVFEGWYTAREGGVKVTETSNLAVNADHTLYAHWKTDHTTVILDGNGGTIEPREHHYPPAYKISNFNSIGLPHRAEYEFTGWYTEPVGGERVTYLTVGENFLIGKTYTLYAHWTPRTSYNVYLSNIFDAITGNPTQGEIKVLSGGTYDTLPTPTRVGYTFVGWYDTYEETGGRRVTNTTPILKNEDHRLWARWTKN